jgi:glycosyltransferase involved in cell wall biosynthesis
MRLLIYGDIGGSGGYVRYCKGLLGSKAIPEAFEIWLVISLPFYEQLEPIDKTVKVITHPWLVSKYRLFRYLWYLWIYPRIVRQIKPDVEFYPAGQRRVYLRKSVTIVTCHNLLLFDTNELVKLQDDSEKNFFKVYRKNQTRSLKRSDAVIFLSGHSQNIVCKSVSSIKRSKIIAHGLDPKFLSKNERSYELKDTVNLLYVSSFYTYKHQLEVVKAVQLLQLSIGCDIRLTLVGGGNTKIKNEIIRYINDQNIAEIIRIEDQAVYSEIIEKYNQADIFIFASSCETFGITLLEAMGTRLPIACSDRTGLPEILKDAGVYFNPEDPQSIYRAVYKLIIDGDLRKALGERAYRYALKYTWERCAEDTFNYIKEINGE